MQSIAADENAATRYMRDVLIISAVVFLASLFGITTRPVGFLAAFWPANALLLALFIRFPRLASPAGWIAATVGYLAADLVTGGDVPKTVWLTVANLIGVAAGFAMSRFLLVDERDLRRPRAMLYIFAICAVAALAACLVGGFASVRIFQHDFITGAGFWFTTEFVNAAIIVPLVLAAPSRKEFLEQARRHISFRALVPALLVVLSVALSHVLGGPGIIAFPVPALLLCALSYSLFATALITLLVCSWQMIAIVGGFILFPMAGDMMEASLSVRLGIALVALGPLTVASVNAARNDLLASLNHAASHDYLTDALSHSAFVAKATSMLNRLAAEGRPVSTLMLDLDRFKAINDRYGHAAGDFVLKTFAGLVREVLRERDIFGRVGGEEFSIVLPDVTPEEARAIAERIRSQVAKTPVQLEDGRQLKVTVSVGLAFSGTRGRLENMMREADGALYRAKESGRNRIVQSGEARPRRPGAAVTG